MHFAGSCSLRLCRCWRGKRFSSHVLMRMSIARFLAAELTVGEVQCPHCSSKNVEQSCSAFSAITCITSKKSA